MRKQGKKLPDEFALADVIMQIKEVSQAAADFNTRAGSGLVKTINGIVQAYSQMSSGDDDKFLDKIDRMKSGLEYLGSLTAYIKKHFGDEDIRGDILDGYKALINSLKEYTKFINTVDFSN